MQVRTFRRTTTGTRRYSDIRRRLVQVRTVWETYGIRQIFLALSPDSPFAVYFIEFHGTYQDGRDRQYLTWIDWLHSQLRRMHRAADSKTPLVPDVPPREPGEDPILYDTWFRSLRNSTPLLTEEDEERLD
ncbi:hypothetical protein FB45DRAFT_1062959 [Roridomyces roridus]|uniref:Uncharacterized protein n=1 Tax=Roridomyces roridus TaxID=1738132 RepID=A0AAD7FHU7_9AGAR|nr:hypothetical protein FB45DRAFT_1062959 [Roridomyces roridus]